MGIRFVKREVFMQIAEEGGVKFMIWENEIEMLQCDHSYILSWCFHAMKGGESHSRNGYLEMDFGWNEILNVRPPVHFIQLTLAMSFSTRIFTAFSFSRCLILPNIWRNICIQGTAFKTLKNVSQMLLFVHFLIKFSVMSLVVWHQDLGTLEAIYACIYQSLTTTSHVGAIDGAPIVTSNCLLK